MKTLKDIEVTSEKSYQQLTRRLKLLEIQDEKELERKRTQYDREEGIGNHIDSNLLRDVAKEWIKAFEESKKLLLSKGIINESSESEFLYQHTTICAKINWIKTFFDLDSKTEE